MTTHVVQYSGGIGSWAATQRVVAEHGTTDLVLLVADTGVEDDDLWRFVHDSTVHIGAPPTIVADGRTPFEVFHDQRFLGNSRLAPCSAILKQRPSRAWLHAHTNPADTVALRRHRLVGDPPDTGDRARMGAVDAAVPDVRPCGVQLERLGRDQARCRP